MLDDQELMGLVIICLVFISAATLRTAHASTTWFRTGARQTHHGTSELLPYKDEDGASTASSTLELALRIPNVPATVAAAMAFFCSAANVVWAYIGPGQSKWLAGWFFLVAWVSSEYSPSVVERETAWARANC